MKDVFRFELKDEKKFKCILVWNKNLVQGLMNGKNLLAS